MVDVLESKGLRQLPANPSAEGSGPPAIERRATARKKLTVEVSAELHRQILMICATRQVPVNQAVREVLERAFPE